MSSKNAFRASVQLPSISWSSILSSMRSTRSLASSRSLRIAASFIWLAASRSCVGSGMAKPCSIMTCNCCCMLAINSWTSSGGSVGSGVASRLHGLSVPVPSKVSRNQLVAARHFTDVSWM